MKKIFIAVVLAGYFALSLSGCAPAKEEGKLSCVASTTMVRDLLAQIGGDKVSVQSLMGSGVDPHGYEPTPGDLRALEGADLVVWQGLGFEQKLVLPMQTLKDQGKRVVTLADGFSQDLLLGWEEDHGHEENDHEDEDHADEHGDDHDHGEYDPHVWFSVSLWKEAAREMQKALAAADAPNAAYYEANLARYLGELDSLDGYIKEQLAQIPANARVLITAHASMRYFAHSYGFTVRGLQGISTEAEASAATVSELADFIAQRQIKAIFIESSVPEKNVKAVQEAVKARGFAVSIGGELYAETLGEAGSGAETYIDMYKHNINTLVAALK